MNCPGHPHKDCPFVGPIRIVGVAGKDFADLTEQKERALLGMEEIG